MQGGKAQRLSSLLDQGIWSAINFVHIWLVASLTPADSLARYVLGFSICLFFSRFQAALITMPMAIDCGADDDKKKQVICRYRSLNSKLLFSITLFGIVLVVLFFWLGIEKAIYGGTILIVAALSVMMNEFIRRVFLLSNEYKALVLFDLAILFVLIVGVYTLVLLGGEGEVVLLGFALSGVVSWVVCLYAVPNRCNKREGSGFFQHSISQSPLLISNISQWASGQSGYYMSAFFMSSIEVFVLAVVRNLFGPLNVVLLSLEGVLPQKMMRCYLLGGARGLRNIVIREMVIMGAVFLLFSLSVYFFGLSLISFVYGEDKAVFLKESHLVGMGMVYGAAILSRVVIIALRTSGAVMGVGKVSLLGLFVFILSSVSLIYIFNLNVEGIIVGMFLSELSMLVLFSVIYFRAQIDGLRK